MHLTCVLCVHWMRIFYYMHLWVYTYLHYNIRDNPITFLWCAKVFVLFSLSDYNFYCLNIYRKTPTICPTATLKISHYLPTFKPFYFSFTLQKINTPPNNFFCAKNLFQKSWGENQWIYVFLYNFNEISISSLVHKV